jgi:hypothetical protein
VGPRAVLNDFGEEKKLSYLDSDPGPSIHEGEAVEIDELSNLSAFSISFIKQTYGCV